ncbi:MAG: 50S ribosomal protein L4 [Aminobacterium colombiense]|jgi:large subunit ribosomal protein L4|uniref:Large ribosomal subunit protein uL4 n=1 Tax=Aminobacterium colombiense (strain DSM 12261 / ALA-1) TaxID=572547 RepID=D5EDY1_AMICL|nr:MULTISPECIES: 50S ribosomal protein L4 [Aminobacterium]MDD2378617.1 50S ribosomal protein L4 [Aminobacterium colombiense]ADE56763.1 ribosomal protein L4/L1e [Aminobacterium colombiense DSM 12261]MDD4264920.1 50S ribosomal protein L4 [Aminobacterium colombiense]MDD4585517.1 50S ribosomal protein L4 [Aminobacterium colombiense]NLK30811.1 50S ribosomal protein L4 [Aminobacterium colombiense]
MPTVKLVSFQGEQVSDLQLSDSVFAAPIHVPAMHQVVVAQLANLRQGTHSCKGRGEVRGGGRKPWRQKHTGRARHGSTRSPIWVGGGVAHGPSPRDYSQKVNKKVRRLALRSALSLKVRDNLLTVVDHIDLDTPSTKEMLGFIDKMGVKKPLIVLHEPNDAVSKSVRNIPDARAINVGNINVYDLLNYQNLILTQEAVARIEEVYSI